MKSNRKVRTYISPGDFIDLYYKVKQVGLSKILSKFRIVSQDRTISKWNQTIPSSNFWDIPAIKSRINEKSTGSPDLGYEDFFVEKHLAGRQNLRMLSVGSGTGTRERRFAKHPVFESIEGIDIAPHNIKLASENALNQGFGNIFYSSADFMRCKFPQNSFDVILFNSSLHHFRNISALLEQKVAPLLRENGFLVIYEYVGPNRLQWTDYQLKRVNELLSELPEKFRKRYGSKSIKKRVFRPGLLRMIAVDPSEAVDSESIISSLRKLFNVIEEKKLGWDILQPLMKDIAHNFLTDNEETISILQFIFSYEDKYIEETGRSDGFFGVYQKL